MVAGAAAASSDWVAIGATGESVLWCKSSKSSRCGGKIRGGKYGDKVGFGKYGGKVGGGKVGSGRCGGGELGLSGDRCGGRVGVMVQELEKLQGRRQNRWRQVWRQGRLRQVGGEVGGGRCGGGSVVAGAVAPSPD